MDPDAINNLLDDSFDSFDDVYSSDEYLPPGMQESDHTSSDSDNISEHSIGVANDEWRYDKNSKRKDVRYLEVFIREGFTVFPKIHLTIYANDLYVNYS